MNLILKKDWLYYLSHPYTTFGDLEQNREDAVTIECDLVNDHDLCIISPVSLPLGTDNDVAMAKCRHLYDACDAVIFCDDWEKSVGCRTEHGWAIEDKKPRYRYRNGEFFEMDDYQEYLDSIFDPRD